MQGIEGMAQVGAVAAWRARGLAWLLAGAVFTSLPAAAATVAVQQTYDFSTPTKSLWGGGTGFSFGTAKTFGPAALNFGWDIGASTGTIDASLQGVLTATHPEARRLPGVVDVGLGFSGTPGSGQLDSELGAWAKVWATLIAQVSLLDYGMKLDPSASFTPVLGQSFKAVDAEAVAGVGVDIGVFSTGVNLAIEQTDTLKLMSVTGDLVYTHMDSGVQYTKPFTISDAMGVQLQPNLPARGWWSFSVQDVALNATFDADFDLGLRFYETHPDGIQWCSRRVWGITLKWPCGLSYDTNEWELASIDVYNGTAFDAGFNTHPLGPLTFMVQVVPEPSAGWLVLLILGGVLLAGRGRRTGRGVQPAATALISAPPRA